MKKATVSNVDQTTEPVADAVHPLKKSHMVISSKHVDYENLTSFEAVTMSMALVLAVLSGILFAA
jgi:hypothetical protein